MVCRLDGEVRVVGPEAVGDEALGDRLGLVVARIDQREARLPLGVERFEEAVVGHVGGDVGVGAGPERTRQEAQPGAAADGHPLDCLAVVPDVPQRTGPQRVANASVSFG